MPGIAGRRLGIVMQERAQVRLRKVGAARLSIFSNTLLTTAKLVVGFLTGSVSVLSEAVHSGVDLAASFIAFFSVRISENPADEGYPYGYGKAESLAGLAEALLIFVAAGIIIVEAIQKLFAGAHALKVDLGIAVMTVSACVNVAVSSFLFRVARETDSPALEADAEHLRTDVYTSVGVLLGLVLVKLTGWSALDPLVGMAIALLIVSTAWRLTRDALSPLMDSQLPPGDVQTVRRILESEGRVLGYHKLRTRKSGSRRHIDAHVQMDDRMTLLDAHELTEHLEDRIREELPNTEVTLHTEPFHAEQRHQHERHGGPQPEGRE